MTTKTKTPTLSALAASLTLDQIRGLQAAAGNAGDTAMVRICRRAADGSARARIEVARVLAEAACRAAD